jgi:antitoxin (DNA-binding transcriptional repressor) of toxin-antitoxin stability system
MLMNASIVDLRYKMNEVLSALERREKVTILYHGKVKGTIVPAESEAPVKICDHPFFGMAVGDKRSVEEVMHDLRAGRFNDL